MQDAQARAALKKGDIEKVCAPESIECDLLDYLFGRILLLSGVGGAIVTELLPKHVNHYSMLLAIESGRYRCHARVI
ncbi:hypothetical protein D9M73_136980 [compost metagenome]